LKVCSEFDDATSAGKLFHVRAAGDGKRSVADSGESATTKLVSHSCFCIRQTSKST